MLTLAAEILLGDFQIPEDSFLGKPIPMQAVNAKPPAKACLRPADTEAVPEDPEL